MKIKTKDFILVSLFAALTAIGAFISIPLGAVPITLQLLFTLLSGILLGGNLGALSQIVYVVLGLVGLPIFAGGKSGVGIIFSPTFGFLIGYIICAFVVGTFCKKLITKKKISLFNILLTCILGVILVYLFGVPYMYIILTKINKVSMTFIGALKAGCLIFLPGDCLKILLSSLLAVKLIPAIKS
ncbi:biotin transporter BioY [Clostridium sp. Marseille-Q7071]